MRRAGPALLIGMLAAAGIAPIVVAAPVAAAPPVPQTFTFTGTEQIYDLPPGVEMLHVVAVGGMAHRPTLLYGQAGRGAVVTADVPVPPGATQLYVAVGGNADAGGDAGWNGGAPAQPPLDVDEPPASGGGGASDIRLCSQAAATCPGGGASLDSRLLVAGGGGGGGAPGTTDQLTLGGHGGDAGAADGSGHAGGNGGSSPTAEGGRAGGGATATAGGAAGASGTVSGPGCERALDGGAGGAGQGGLGGGGGGWFGGGGGGMGGECPANVGDPLTFAASGGGGAGSSHVVAGAFGVSYATDTSATPRITITPGLVLGPSTLPSGAVTVPYSQPLSATFGDDAVDATFAVASGALPPGLTLSPTGVLSGTPTLGGSVTFAIDAADTAGHRGRRTYTMEVTVPGVQIMPATLPDAAQGASYSQQLTAQFIGVPLQNATFSIRDGALPAGITLSPDGLLSGRTDATGAHSFTVQASVAGIGDVFRGYTLTVHALEVTPASLPDGSPGAPYSQQLGVLLDGAPASSATFDTGDTPLPPGLSLSTSGLLAGTPTIADTFPLTVVVTVAGFGPAEKHYTLNIAGLVLVPRTLPAAPVNQPYAQQLALEDVGAPVAGATFSITDGAPPPGLTLSPSGAITGSPTTPGSFSFTARGVSGDESASRDYTLAVTTPPQRFEWTTEPQEYIVVPGTTSLVIEAVGGDGTPVGNVAGGQGAKVVAELPVPAGVSRLIVTVGGDGPTEDGTNGGQPNGGGGASDVRTCSSTASSCPGGGSSLASRLVVAGGGGAAGLAGFTQSGFPAGGRGGDAGTSAEGAGGPGAGGEGVGSVAGGGGHGGGGTASSGGSLGGGGAACPGGVHGLTGAAGSPGAGGACGGGGGGGGGGWFGGGGGGGGATCTAQAAEAGSGGGGGGSSSVHPSALSFSITTTSGEENSIVITPTFGTTEPEPEPPEAPGGSGPGEPGPGNPTVPDDPAPAPGAGAGRGLAFTGLAFTGADPTRWAWVGAGFLAFGVALVVATRRRAGRA